jgi:hypothetical protein
MDSFLGLVLAFFVFENLVVSYDFLRVSGSKFRSGLMIITHPRQNVALTHR